MASGIGDVLRRFDKVLAVENNWSDSPDGDLIGTENRRYSSLAWLLRAQYLVDIDCWGEVRGQPLKPGAIIRAALSKLEQS
jgi:2-oxoglutarate ferredoxin oxidoreductase subunit alpha